MQHALKRGQVGYEQAGPRLEGTHHLIVPGSREEGKVRPCPHSPRPPPALLGGGAGDEVLDEKRHSFGWIEPGVDGKGQRRQAGGKLYII